jgi:hypothetical protein
VVTLQEFAPYATGLLKLQVFAPRLPRSAQLALSAPRRSGLGFGLDVNDAKGHDLYHAANAALYRGAFQGDLVRPEQSAAGFAYCDVATDVPLKNLLRDVETIASVRGRLSLILPKRVERVRFDRLTPGAQSASGAFRVTLRRVEPWVPSAVEEQNFARTFPMTEVAVEYAGAERGPVEVLAFDGQGQPLGGKTAAAVPAGTLMMQVPQKTAALEVQVTAAVDVLSHDFQLRDVPFTRQLMPARLEPVRFPGHPAPVSVEFVAWSDYPFNFNMLAQPNRSGPARNLFAHVRAVNHSDKAVERLQLALTYRDADGKVVHEMPFTYNLWPISSSGLSLPNVIRRGDEGEFYLANQHDAKQLTIKVVEVGFADATIWKP